MKSSYTIITKESQLHQAILGCKKTGYASVDFETTGIRYYSDDEYPLCLAICYQPGHSWILPLRHSESPFLKKNLWKKLFNKFCDEVMADSKIIKVGWNFKFEYKWFISLGKYPSFVITDGMLAKYCLDEERPHDLKNMVAFLFPEFAGYESEIKVKGNKWANIPLDKLSKYNGIDADLTLRIFIYFESKLMKLGFYNLFRNLLMMASRVLGESEFRGMPIDMPYLLSLESDYAEKLEVLDTELRKHKALKRFEHHQSLVIAESAIEELRVEIKNIKKDSTKTEGSKQRMIAHRKNKITALKSEPKEFKINFNSPPQLAEYFFNSEHGLKLKPIKNTDSGAPSTDEASLELLKKKDKSGFMESLLKYRGISKLYSTYIRGMIPLVTDKNRVHASFLIHGTVTGRLSCSDPNLQNIPRDTTSSEIKKMFVPPLNFLLLEVDYSQAELRVVAELANDETMICIFERGYNIHVATACLANGGLHLYEKAKAMIKVGDSMGGEELAKPENKEYLFWIKQKKRAKLINFGILYGQEAKKLSEELDCSLEEAAEFKAQWLNQYPGVKKWISNQKKFVREEGYVRSMFGRKRRLYNIDHPNKWIRLEAERQAVHTPIQGTASDFTLLSQVVIREQILQGKLPHDLQQLYTVHDSIGYAIRPQDIHETVPKLIEICNNPDTLKYFGFELKKVRMKVSPEVGINWGSLGEYEPTQDYTKLLNPEYLKYAPK